MVSQSMSFPIHHLSSLPTRLCPSIMREKEREMEGEATEQTNALLLTTAPKARFSNGLGGPDTLQTECRLPDHSMPCTLQYKQCGAARHRKPHSER
jgi:hypothetical protein